jgi:hypothetical protein
MITSNILIEQLVKDDTDNKHILLNEMKVVVDLNHLQIVNTIADIVDDE